MAAQEIGLSVLSAPVPLSDRRALSQAWYSALHVATHQPNMQPRTSSGAVVAQPNRAEHAGVQQDRSARVSQAIPRPAHLSRTNLTGEPDRRCEKLALAKKIEARFARASKATNARATFSLDGKNGRVQIVMRATSNGAHLIALCPRSATPKVRVALAQARYALAARGIELHAMTQST